MPRYSGEKKKTTQHLQMKPEVVSEFSAHSEKCALCGNHWRVCWSFMESRFPFQAEGRASAATMGGKRQRKPASSDKHMNT